VSSPLRDESERHTFIGGSEAFELIGERQYGRGCARALAYRKLGTPEDVPSESVKQRAIEMRALFDRGHILEDVVAHMYMTATGRSLLRRNRLVRHHDFPGAAVHTDRIIVTCDERGPGDAEIKTHNEGPFLHILRAGLPPAHNLQIQWSMFITGHLWGAFIICGVFGGLPLKHFDVMRDPALMDIFADAVENFWNTLKAGDLPPQLADASDIRCKVCPYRLTCRGEMLDPVDYRALLAEREGRRLLVEVSNDELDQALADRALIKSEIEALDSNSKEDPGALQLINERIKELIGDQDAILVNKHWKVYSFDNTWSGVDLQRLKEHYPEAYKNCYVSKRTNGTKKLAVYALHDGKVA
jgi:predicted phage-related endonuclease